MRTLVGIGINPRKERYIKPDSVKALERMADDEARRLHPTCPHLASRVFRDDSAASLTTCITAYLRLKGAFCSRLNNTGIYDKRLQRYRPGTNRKGLPDILATYQGKSLFIEVKASGDKVSQGQECIRDEQTSSGGYYFIAHNFTTFQQWLNSIQ